MARFEFIDYSTDITYVVDHQWRDVYTFRGDKLIHVSWTTKDGGKPAGWEETIKSVTAELQTHKDRQAFWFDQGYLMGSSIV